MNGFIYKARVILIRLGKALPFIICFIVLISYAESLISLSTGDFIVYDDEIIPRKRLSWLIGQYFEYNAQMLAVLFIISFAIETCIYNKLSCLYLGVNLFEKYWFAGHETDINTCIAVCSVNIVVAVYLTYKGIRMLTIN